MNIKNMAEKLCTACGSRNPFTIADYLGVIIDKKPFDNLLGYYYKYKNHGFIIVNSNIDNKDSVRTIVAHELGHALLHEDCDYPYFSTAFFKQTKPEREANEFAAELLIPDEIISSNPGATVEELASIAHCSVKLFDYKKWEMDG